MNLHRMQNCGYSLRELIALYETVRDNEKIIRFDMEKAGKLTSEDVRAHLPLIGQLTAAGSAVSGGIVGNKLTGVGLTSYSAEVRSSLGRAAEEYREALKNVRQAINRVAGIIGVRNPENRAEINAMRSLMALYREKKETEPLLLELLKAGTNRYGLPEQTRSSV